MGHGMQWLALLASLLALGGTARADGLSFDGDVPLFPHVGLALEASQKRQLAADARKGVRYPELRLTRAQQEALKKETGATVPWVFAVDRKTVGGECTCGSYNLAVVIGDQLAVYKSGLGDYLSPGDLKATDAKVGGGAPPKTGEPTPPERNWTWLNPGQARDARLDALLAKLPGGRFERNLKLAEPWRAATVRLPALPRIGGETGQDAVGLFSDAARVSARAMKGDRITWPDAAASLEEKTGQVTWVVPGITLVGIATPVRAWVLLQYRSGKLAAILAVPEVEVPVGWVDESLGAR